MLLCRLGVISSLLIQVFSWSAIGHDAVGRIAMTFLDPHGEKFVKELLDVPSPNDLDQAIIFAGRWPDQVPDDMEWSRDLHFATTPTRNCVGFDYNRDCPRCIVSGIANYTMRALNPGLDMNQRAEALRFVIHFMGDIHIPMHIGFKGDSGGNAIAISGLNTKFPVNLHNVWDYHLIEPLDRKSLPNQCDALPTTFVDNKLNALSPANINYSTILNAATDMAYEANKIACTSSYRHTRCNGGECWIESGDSLEKEYWESNYRVAATQLKLAGFRLATLLNLMAVSKPIDFTVPKSPKPHPQTNHSPSYHPNHSRPNSPTSSHNYSPNQSRKKSNRRTTKSVALIYLGVTLVIGMVMIL